MSESNKETTVDQLKAELLAMENERKVIESKLAAQRLILDKQNVGMTDTLVDKDDFPRNDIDVWAVRTARSNIVRLENDAKNIFNQMSSKLEQLHSLTKPDN